MKTIKIKMPTTKELRPGSLCSFDEKCGCFLHHVYIVKNILPANIRRKADAIENEIFCAAPSMVVGPSARNTPTTNRRIRDLFKQFLKRVGFRVARDGKTATLRIKQ